MNSSRLQALFKPELYHGWGRKKKYFEGWFYKIVNRNENYSFVISPGISMDEKGNKQAFIQLLDGQNSVAEFITFPFEDFKSSKTEFRIHIGNNIFSKDEIILDLPQFKGSIMMSDHVNWPSKLFSPGTMGPFTFVPKMEVYHDVHSLSSKLSGSLEIKGEFADFTGGRGYIEKDWGHTFPSSHIWIQCNHFSRSDVALIGLVAKIPWWKISFPGFVAALWYEGRLLKFTTYNFSKIEKSKVDSKKVTLIFKNSKYRLKMVVTRSGQTAELASPVSGLMDDRFTESLTANMKITLYDKKQKKVLLSEIGENVGLEVSGNVAEIQVNS